MSTTTERTFPKITDEGRAWIDESDYYYIKVENELDADGQKRTLVLDNLIHGYFILEHPERLDYDYQHLYALVTDRVARSRAVPGPAPPLRTLFLGAGAYTFPRYILHQYPGSLVDAIEIDPAVVRANAAALGLTTGTPIRTVIGDARLTLGDERPGTYDLLLIDAFSSDAIPMHLMTREAFENAITVVIALAGSTNAVLHLLAMAHAAHVPLELDDFTRSPEL
jgi:spermidine synthase